MTLRMLDSIDVGNLPDGADAYLGYVDGTWPTWTALAARFGGKADLLSMAISATADADGCDMEPLDLDPGQVPLWVVRQIGRGVHRPVVYCSIASMGAVLGELGRAGVGRSEVRLLSAHYGKGAHICGPRTCAWPGAPQCDGTQWTDTAAGVNGTLIDESAVAGDFFTIIPAAAAAPAIPAEDDMIILNEGNGEKTSVAIPAGCRDLHLVTGGVADLVIEWHGAEQTPVTVSWADGSKFVPVPAQVHAAVVVRQKTGCKEHVALAFS
jgi:hypothetical protein